MQEEYSSKMLFWVIGIITVLYFLKECWYNFRVWNLLRKIDGPKASSFIFGNSDILCQPPEILYKKVKELCETYYPNCYLRVFNVCALIIMDPEDCEIFMSTPKHSRKSILYLLFSTWLKDGLLLSSGKKWQERRKILTPAFHFGLLKEFIKTFNEKADDFITSLSSKGTEAINVVPEIHEFSLSTINETAMGTKMGELENNHQEYRENISKMEALINQWIVRPWLQIYILQRLSPFYEQQKKVVKVLHNYTESIIRKRMKETEDDSSHKCAVENETCISKKRKRMAMLDILLEAYKNNEIDHKGICEEVDTFTFEGHDTISSALAFCMMLIGNHPDIQDRILEEINSVVGEEVNHPTYEELQNMEFLDRCIKESLRLYPSVHIISRVIDEDTKLHSGQIVPKDALIVIPILFIHQNPIIYPNPEKFDPDRFLSENCAQRHPFAYIPFSAGPRNCIGQRFAMLEMKVLLSRVIKKFQLISVDKPETIELKLETILRARNGIRIKFIPRP